MIVHPVSPAALHQRASAMQFVTDHVEGRDFAIAMAIAGSVDEYGLASPGERAIAKRIGREPKTVGLAIHRLEAAGHVIAVRRGRGHVVTYRFPQVQSLPPQVQSLPPQVPSTAWHAGAVIATAPAVNGTARRVQSLAPHPPSLPPQVQSSGPHLAPGITGGTNTNLPPSPRSGEREGYTGTTGVVVLAHTAAMLSSPAMKDYVEHQATLRPFRTTIERYKGGIWNRVKKQAISYQDRYSDEQALFTAVTGVDLVAEAAKAASVTERLATAFARPAVVTGESSNSYSMNGHGDSAVVPLWPPPTVLPPQPAPCPSRAPDLDDVEIGVWEPDPAVRHQRMVELRGDAANRAGLLDRIADSVAADEAKLLAKLQAEQRFDYSPAGLR